MRQFQLRFPISYAVHPTLWIHLCRLHLFFSISTARSSHILTHGKSSTLWPLCHNGGPYPLTYVGMLWRAQKDSEQGWISVVFVFRVLGTNFLSLFTVSWAGWLPVIPCRNALCGGCWGAPSHNSRYDCRVLVLLLLPESWREVMPADICFIFTNLFNAKLHHLCSLHMLWFKGKQKVTFQDQIYWV